MSGGKGGSQSSAVTIPEFVRGPAERNLERAEQAAMLGPMIYGGPDVAAFTQPQIAGMQATADAAAAMGLSPQMNVAASLPQAQSYGGGITGYSGMSLYDQALAELNARAPGQVQQLQGMFVDPITGEMPQSYVDAIAREQAARTGAMSASPFMSGGDGSQFDGQTYTTEPMFNSFGEMVDTMARNSTVGQIGRALGEITGETQRGIDAQGEAAATYGSPF